MIVHAFGRSGTDTEDIIVTAPSDSGAEFEKKMNGKVIRVKVKKNVPILVKNMERHWRVLSNASDLSLLSKVGWTSLCLQKSANATVWIGWIANSP